MKKLKANLKTICILFFIYGTASMSGNTYAQVAINMDGSSPHPSSILDISSTAGGLLLPRMTTAQMEAIPSPPDYMMIVNTTEKKVFYFNPNLVPSAWASVDSHGITSGDGAPSEAGCDGELYFDDVNDLFYICDGTNWSAVSEDDGDWVVSGDDVYSSGSGNVGIGTTGPAEKLHVVGSIRMVDGNQATGYVMTSDANGTASWTDASASMGGGYTMQWGGELLHDSYAEYGGKAGEGKKDASSYRTRGIVPIAGTITTYSWSSELGDASSVIAIIKNGTPYNMQLTGSAGVMDLPTPIPVVAGDVIEIKGTNTGTGPFHTGMTLYIEL